jgi:acyl dehydratase
MDAITFPIEAGHVMMFARAIADPNPVYHDAECAARSSLGGVIAPPTFTEALQQFIPEYPMRPSIGGPWIGSGRAPSGQPTASDGGTTFHAEQHFVYHGVIRVGDVLTATRRQGDEYEKQGRRGGRLVFREVITEFRNQAGVLVVTARQVAVETQQPVEARA